MTDPPAPDPWVDFDGHESVIVAQDESTGLQQSSPSLQLSWGRPSLVAFECRRTPTHRLAHAAAYADALRLSRAMTYKNALAGLPHGGGKAVIVHDPSNKPPKLLHAFELVTSLGGRYVTAGDVGMRVQDMDVISETCRWTTGRSPENGGVGDSGILTSVGVHLGMRAGAEAALGTADLSGVTVGVIGAGKVGGRLIGHLIRDRAQVIALDPSAAARSSLDAEYPNAITWVDSLAELLAYRPQVLSRCSGGAISEALVEDLASAEVRLVCGGQTTSWRRTGSGTSRPRGDRLRT